MEVIPCRNKDACRDRTSVRSGRGLVLGARQMCQDLVLRTTLRQSDLYEQAQKEDHTNRGLCSVCSDGLMRMHSGQGTVCPELTCHRDAQHCNRDQQPCPGGHLELHVSGLGSVHSAGVPILRSLLQD